MNTREGIALIIAVLALVLIEAMTVGVIAMTQHARAAAEMHNQASRSQLANEQAVNAVIRSWNWEVYDSIAVGSAKVVRDVEIERLTNATFLVKGKRAMAVARLLDRPRAIGEATDLRLVMDTAIAIGGVRWSEADSIADLRVDGTIALTDTISGDAPLWLAAGDLTIAAGAGRGILLVKGNLVMQGGVFVGYVVVRGSITLSGGAHIYGAVRSRTAGLLAADPSVSFWPDTAARVIATTPSAHRLILQQRLYIPSF